MLFYWLHFSNSVLYSNVLGCHLRDLALDIYMQNFKYAYNWRKIACEIKNAWMQIYL